MDANPVAAFVAALSEHQLLSPAQLEEVSRSPLLQGSDPRALGKELIERGWLTPFQVGQLVQGRGKDLLVGPYLLLERIGEGGMGQVFKARHRSTNQLVAVKLVRNQLLANPNALRRFWQEFNLTAQLRHPNIVLALGAGQVPAGHYFSMEYIEGIDLFRLVRESGPPGVGRACDYMRQAALGLQHAHEKGLVHRDIKPANLMVSGSQLKLLDLGLARLQDQDQESGLTRIGAILGTPEYLSPEQTQNSRGVDIRSDLYSLGCTFFWLLIGKEPFSAPSVPELLLKHHFDEPPLLTPLRPDVPAGVQAIVRKLMAKRPEDRYQTPAELAEPLRPFAQPSSAKLRVPAAARPIKPGKVASAFALMLRRKNKGKVAPTAPSNKRPRSRSKGPLLAVGLCVLVLALGAFLVSAFGIPGWTKSTTDADKPAEVAAVPAPTGSNLGSKPTEPTRRDTRPETKPETKPVTKPATKPETKPTPKPEPKPETPPAGKKAIPDAERQAEAEKQVRAAHKDDYAKKKPADQLALADRLLRERFDAQNDDALRFVLYREARDLAAQAGDLEASFRAIAEMETWFTVDVREQKADALDVARTADLPASTMKAVAEKALAQAERAVDANDYAAAARMLTAADEAARKAKSAALAKQAQTRGKEVADMGKEFALVKGDAETLKTQPDSAEANFRWGRFLCLFRDKWSDGLPLLAKGSNPKWKALAKKEGTDPSASADQMDLAEGWLALAGQEKGAARKQLLRRAKHWFELATPRLTELARFKVDKRIREIDQETGDASGKPISDKLIITGKKYEQSMQAGTAALDQGKFGDAIQAFGEALYWKPNDPEATTGKRQALYSQFMERGNAALEKKRYGDAAAEFMRALKEKPGDAEAKAALDKAEAMGK